MGDYREDKGWKIVVFTDTKYMRIAQIWWKRMLQLGYDNILILALELNAYKILQNQVGKGELRNDQIRLASFVLESFMKDDLGNNITDMNVWLETRGGKYSSGNDLGFLFIFKVNTNVQ